VNVSSLAWIDFDEAGEQFRFDLRGLVLRIPGKQPAQTGNKGRIRPGKAILFVGFGR
jgi:hypothetical protein